VQEALDYALTDIQLQHEEKDLKTELNKWLMHEEAQNRQKKVERNGYLWEIETQKKKISCSIEGETTQKSYQPNSE